MKQIAIYGAFDRFNYGDLLFPLILERIFEKYSNDYEINYYGIIKSDLSVFGGKPTKTVETLFTRDYLEKDSIVIIAGGEVLASRWFEIYSCLLPENLQNFTKALRKNIPREFLNKVKPSLQTTKLEQPFIIAPEDFNNHVKVVYNSVGGSSLKDADFSPRQISSLVNKLEKATFISVREQVTLDFLNSKSSSVSVKLAPDSASLMSKFYPKESLFTMINPVIADRINQFKDGYLSLQIGWNYAKDQETIEDLAHEVETIYYKYQLPTVFCPIGTAICHQDQVPLKSIQKLIKTPSYLAENASIFDLMALIANSTLFIGTSLHGAITAMSFSVPNLALTLNVHKLAAYLDTWGIPSLRGMVPIYQMSSEVERAISVPKEQLEWKRQELITKSLESFILMEKAL